MEGSHREGATWLGRDALGRALRETEYCRGDPVAVVVASELACRKQAQVCILHPNAF